MRPAKPALCFSLFRLVASLAVTRWVEGARTRSPGRMSITVCQRGITPIISAQTDEYEARFGEMIGADIDWLIVQSAYSHEDPDTLGLCHPDIFTCDLNPSLP